MVKQTFLSFKGLDQKQAIYEIAIKLVGHKFVVTTTEDILQDGLPCQSRSEFPPYGKREVDSLEKANLYHAAHIASLKKTRCQNGWVLIGESCR